MWSFLRLQPDDDDDDDVDLSMSNPPHHLILTSSSSSASKRRRKFCITARTMVAVIIICASVSTSFMTTFVRAFVRSSSSSNNCRTARSVAFAQRKSTGAAFSSTRGVSRLLVGRQQPSPRLFASTTTSDDTTATTTARSKNSNDDDHELPYDLLNKQRGLGQYTPSDFEANLYKWWEQSGCFQPPPASSDNKKKPYVLPMPPPNVTGRLHMGHAIFVALQDVLARFHRMRGRPVLWLPGEYSTAQYRMGCNYI